MFASKLFRKAAIAGLAAALFFFCAPAQSFAKETVKVGFIGPLTGGLSLWAWAAAIRLSSPFRKPMRIPIPNSCTR